MILYEKTSVNYLIQLDNEGYEKVRATTSIDAMKGDVSIHDELVREIGCIFGVKNVDWDLMPAFLNVEIDAIDRKQTLKKVIKTIEKHIKGDE